MPAPSPTQLAALSAHGLAVFETEAAYHHWLQAACPALGHVPPQSLLASVAGCAQVREILGRIQWGIFS